MKTFVFPTYTDRLELVISELVSRLNAKWRTTRSGFGCCFPSIVVLSGDVENPRPVLAPRGSLRSGAVIDMCLPELGYGDGSA